MMSKFNRENRYIVIKRTDLRKLPVRLIPMSNQMLNLLPHLPKRECLVIESDWPEYEAAWNMIENRVNSQGKPGDFGVKAEDKVRFALDIHLGDDSPDPISKMAFSSVVSLITPLLAELELQKVQSINDAEANTAIRAERDALQLLLNDRDEQLHTLEQSRRSHFENAQAAERRINELTSKTGPDTPVCRGSTALGTACGKCARCRAPLGEVKFKGMIETACGTFAIMIDEANVHYGWTFQRHPDGMWVSGRKATEAEMNAARAHAKILALF